jgi:5-hydroxyisourate hydrolase
MKSITTHVLDVALGRPAAQVPVVLERKEASGGYARIGAGVTDADGRNRALMAEGALTAGTYRITFDIAAYHASIGVDGFYPEASIVFTVRDAESHYHVPLLLSPFGYSTYRGS